MSTKFEKLSDSLFSSDQVNENQLFEVKGRGDFCNSYRNTYVYQNGDHIIITDDGSLSGRIEEGWI